MIVMTVDRREGGRYHAHLRVKQDGDSWKITSIDRI